jgi:hypothetical protein
MSAPADDAPVCSDTIEARGIRRPKHDQSFVAFRYVLPDGIGTRDMAGQDAVSFATPVEAEWNMIGIEPVPAMRDQHTERVTLDQIIQDVETRFTEVRRYIHR